jgi:hypothetical protein
VTPLFQATWDLLTKKATLRSQHFDKKSHTHSHTPHPWKPHRPKTIWIENLFKRIDLERVKYPLLSPKVHPKLEFQPHSLKILSLTTRKRRTNWTNAFLSNKKYKCFLFGWLVVCYCFAFILFLCLPTFKSFLFGCFSAFLFSFFISFFFT